MLRDEMVVAELTALPDIHMIKYVISKANTAVGKTRIRPEGHGSPGCQLFLCVV